MADTFEGGQRIETTKSTQENTEPKDGTFDGVDDASIIQEMRVRPYRAFFNIEGGADDEKVDYILRYINPKNQLKKEEVLEKLHTISGRIGNDWTGPAKLTKVFNYIKIVRSLQEDLLTQI